MNQADVRPPAAAESVAQPRPHLASALGAGAICAAVLALGAGLRSFELGRLSFWYDEVVTMRLARAGSPGALVERLFQIDATRAPLHPILLQAWLKVFGTSEASARSLSVVCGVATIVLIFLIGRIVFDAPTGLWAAWLGALSPILIVYAREARMYAWLVLVTCSAWLALLALVAALHGPDHGLWVEPGGAGLLPSARARDGGDSGSGRPDRGSSVFRRVPALAAGASRSTRARLALDRELLRSSARIPQRASAASISAGRADRVHWRRLPGSGALLLLIIAGLLRHTRGRRVGREEQPAFRYWLGPAFLLLWFALPPTLLYLYSLVSYPIFGPARYTAFVAPAFLVLVAAGLRSLPALVRYPAAGVLAIVSALALGPLAYDPEQKADWRAFALAVSQTRRDRPGDRIVVIVASSEAARNVEVETARYYLPASCTVIAALDATPERLDGRGAEQVYFAVGLRHGEPAATVPEWLDGYQFRDRQRYPGLVVYRGVR